MCVFVCLCQTSCAPGDVGYILVELHDKFGNLVADAAPSDLAALLRHETDEELEPVRLQPEGLACGLGMEQYRCALINFT